MTCTPTIPTHSHTKDSHARGRQAATKGLAALVLTLLLVARAPGAVLSIDQFLSDPGWQDRDALEMTASYSAGFGNAAGSVRGSFASQAIPAFESDAFRLNGAENDGSGGPWAGGANYNSLYSGFSSFTFDFFAEDVLPSAFTMRISDGSFTFSYSLTLQVAGTGVWNPITVPLYHSPSWVGIGSGANFTNMFSSVSFIDLQIVRNGSGAQDYFIDNFALTSDSPPPPAAVPEASTIGMGIIGLGLAYLRLRDTRRRKAKLDKHVPTLT